MLIVRHLAPHQEGRFAIVTSVWVRGAMDALVCGDEARRCGRQNRVVLIPRRYREIAYENPEDAPVLLGPARSSRHNDRSRFDSASFSIRFHVAVSARANGARPSNGINSEIPYAIALPDAGIKLLARRFARATVAIKPGHRGERGAAVKTIAQGMPVDPAEPVVTAACVFCCRRAMGEAITRHSLRPLDFGGTMMMHHSGISCCENADVRHCEERSDEAIQTVSAVAFWIASLRSQ